jgi:hypothetical protein
MAEGFTKLTGSILRSTVWSEPHATRIVWITLLALSNRDGSVWASVPGLAHEARVTLEECQTALNTFLAPDPYSRTKENEGRRIREIDGGWFIINYGKHRTGRDDEAQKERHARNQAAYRERKRLEQRDQDSDRVTDNMTESDPIAEADSRGKSIYTPKSNYSPAEGAKNAPIDGAKKPKREVDPRFAKFKELLAEYWKFKNPSVPDMPWGAADATNLSRMLKENPSLTEAQFRKCLRNRTKSDVNHGDPIRTWVLSITKYAEGPVDRFNQPGGDSNASRGELEARRQAREDREVVDELRGGRRSGAVGDESPIAGRLREVQPPTLEGRKEVHSLGVGEDIAARRAPAF